MALLSLKAVLKHLTMEQQKQQYTCRIHAEIIRDAPGSCPLCGMTMVPMENRVGKRRLL